MSVPKRSSDANPCAATGPYGPETLFEEISDHVPEPDLPGITSGLLVTQEKSRNSPGLFSKLVWSAGLCGLPQFDRISLRVMHAGKPAGGIGRVNLDLDSSGP